MKLLAVDWAFSIEKESCGLEINIEFKKHRRSHFTTLLSPGQSASACELAPDTWAAIRLKEYSAGWKLDLLCKNDKALYYYHIEMPAGLESVDTEEELEPTWSLAIAESLFNDSAEAHTQANTGLALLLTDTSLNTLKLSEKVQSANSADSPWQNNAKSLTAMQ